MSGRAGSCSARWRSTRCASASPGNLGGSEAMVEARLVVDARNRLGEVPVWDPIEGALWWVDIEGRLLQKHVPATGETRRWTMPERIGSFALRERGGGLVAALETGFAFLELD